MLKGLVILICIFVPFISKTFKNEIEKLDYDFNKPIVNITLPVTLHEISGITIIDSTTVACIQDENGILFLYDIKLKQISKQVFFAINGDYEGICRVHQTLYILRSDGTIFEIENYTAEKLKVKEYKTGIPAFNNEGLCYDKENNRLLIGAKGKINKDPMYKDKRFIYEFNLSTKLLSQKPLFSFNINTINLFAKNNGIKLRKRTTKDGKVIEIGLKLNTSEIAIHPITKKLYVLSGVDYCLFVYSPKGELEHIEQLNSAVFNKAEGLSFFPNGDLIITNEGQTHQPTLLRFNYKPS